MNSTESVRQIDELVSSFLNLGANRLLEYQDDVRDELRKLFKRWDNRLTLQGLSLSDSYLKGRIQLAVDFDLCSSGETNKCRATFWRDPHFSEEKAVHSAVSHVNVFEAAEDRDSGKSNVFVSKVEIVKGAHTTMVPSWVRFDEPLECVNDVFAGALYFSFNRGFVTIPINPVRKVDILRRLAVQSDKIAGEEIQSGPQVMNGVSENCGEILGDAFALDGSKKALSGFRIVLDDRRVWVSCNKFTDSSVEIVDVLVGPFDL